MNNVNQAFLYVRESISIGQGGALYINRSGLMDTAAFRRLTSRSRCVTIRNGNHTPTANIHHIIYGMNLKRSKCHSAIITTTAY